MQVHYIKKEKKKTAVYELFATIPLKEMQKNVECGYFIA